MDVRYLIKKLTEQDNLSYKEMVFLLDEAVAGRITQVQIGAFLTALKVKGETGEEIYSLVKYISDNCLRIGPFEDVIDIHGTGGDDSNSFNISSTTIFIVAAAGAVIAKHGNRSSSSRSGSADVIEALGVNIDLEPEQVNECVRKIGIGFMFAQRFHPKLKPFVDPRKELGFATIFNKAFPLVSPANVKSHFLGVTDWKLAPLFAEVLKKQGCKRFMLVHGQDPMDEISISSSTDIYEYLDGKEKQYSIKPEDLGFKRCSLSDIQGGTPQENAEIVKRILSNVEIGPKREIILLNSAASFIIAGKVKDWQEGIELADKMITSGKAWEKLQELVKLSNSFVV